MIPLPTWPKRSMPKAQMRALWKSFQTGVAHVSPSGWSAYQLALYARAQGQSFIVKLHVDVDHGRDYWTIQRARNA